LTVGVESPSLERTLDQGYSKEEGETGGESQRIREETWKGLVDFTRARNPVLGSFLALGALVHMDDEKIEIGFEKDSFHYERIIEKGNRTQLESICDEFLGKNVKVIISALDQEVRSRGRVISGGAVRDEMEKGSGRRAEENPLIQEALRIFNGKVVEG